MKLDTKNIIYKYIVIISMIFLLFLIGRIYYDYHHRQDMMKDRLLGLHKTIHTTVFLSKKNLIKKYKMLSIQYMNSPLIVEYLKNNKREKLYDRLKNDYKDYIKIDPNLYVMHFFDKKNNTILRMHKPQSYGDDLTDKRPIVKYVNETKKEKDGFEVGKNGIVYRITLPFLFENQHLGVLEFGVKLDYFINILNEKNNLSYVHLVKTDKLNVLLKKEKYKQVKDYSIVSKNTTFSGFEELIDFEKDHQVIRKNGKTYLACFLELNDYKGEVVSKIVYIKDITKDVQQNDIWFQLVNLSSFLVYLLVVLMMYIILKKFSIEINNKIKTITRLHRKSKYLQDKANTDELTKAFNKRYFDKYLDNYLDSKVKGSLLFIDIDHFKKINDTHGHLVGDEILKGLSKVVQENLREDDLFVRWGGEEFAVLLKDIPLKISCKKAESLRKIIESTKFYNDINITVSIGLCEIEEHDNKDILIKRTDDLLYKAKESGRNKVVF